MPVGVCQNNTGDNTGTAAQPCTNYLASWKEPIKAMTSLISTSVTLLTEEGEPLLVSFQSQHKLITINKLTKYTTVCQWSLEYKGRNSWKHTTITSSNNRKSCWLIVYVTGITMIFPPLKVTSDVFLVLLCVLNRKRMCASNFTWQS